jgi:hypothetical protein
MATLIILSILIAVCVAVDLYLMEKNHDSKKED